MAGLVRESVSVCVCVEWWDVCARSLCSRLAMHALAMNLGVHYEHSHRICVEYASNMVCINKCLLHNLSVPLLNC
ncbi:hypothetical protein BpHYR1_005759 [Brachionus plicatilis]|uniref:Uncharacterized protein n=1 Tax=Brachionus plicatilis TaxID=10195 RepID=A0A3M7R7S2_BRAPC|nr:hypothetical protein BpHYR1_005759 [Brachionus plicatilis]